MAEKLESRMEIVELAERAVRTLGLEPVRVPIRGGTDGAQLSFRGLPCPNLPTGSYGHHGPFEHAVAEEMDACAALLVQIAAEFAK
jgi:tripeptide aminopeptidase